MKKLSLLLLLLSTTTVLRGQDGISSPYADRFRHIVFLNLGAPTAGRVYYCDNCSATAPCMGGGSGAVAFRVGSAWNCSTGTPGGSGTVTSVGLAGTANQITVTGASPITTSGSWALSFPAGGVTLPGTTTGTFSGNLTGNASGTSGSTTGNAATATALAANPVDCSANQYATAIAANGNLTCGSIVAADLPATAVTPGAYTSSNITVDQQGRITAAASGSGASAPFSDGTALVKNASDATKQFTIDVSGVTTGNNPVFTIGGTTAGPTFNWLGSFTTGISIVTPAVNLGAAATSNGEINIFNSANTRRLRIRATTMTATADRIIDLVGTGLTANRNYTLANGDIDLTPLITANVTGTGGATQKTSPQFTADVGVGVAAAAGSGLTVEAPTTESTLGVDNVRIGVVGGTPRLTLEDGASLDMWEVDNSAGVLRFLTPGLLAGTLDKTGNAVFVGSVTPSQTGGIIGTTTNNNANAGSVGEYITGTVAANTTSLATGTSINVGTATNITLTAGDWDCTGAINYTFGATTSITNLTGGVSTTTGTLPAQDQAFDYETSAMVPTGTAVATWPVPTVRILASGSTNVFLVAQGTFSISTIKVGGTIRCRRMR